MVASAPRPPPKLTPVRWPEFPNKGKWTGTDLSAMVAGNTSVYFAAEGQLFSFQDSNVGVSVLNIIDRNSNSATCVGTTRFNKRCRWDISGANIREIRMLLDEGEKNRPMYVKIRLGKLAELSLCNEYHRGQASQFMEAWGYLVDDTEANLATDSQTIDDLKLKLRERTIKFAHQSKSLKLAAKNEDALQNEVELQRSQLARQRRDLDQTKRVREKTLLRMLVLEAQGSIQRKMSDKLEHDLVQAAAKQASLSQEVTSLQQHHANELGNAAHLRSECDNLKAELSSAQNSIMHAQLNLENCHKARDAQKTELDSLRVTLKVTMAELSDSRVATEKQFAKLNNAQNRIKQVQLDLQTLCDANVELEANLTAALSTLRQIRLDFENKTAEKQQAELAISYVQTTLDQTVVELVNSRKSNEEHEIELSTVKKLLQQTELDLEMSRKVDKNQKADLEHNLNAKEEQKAELASTQALLKASQVELEISRKTALEQKEDAEAVATRMQAQIVGLKKQLSRGFMDRVVLRFKTWFATVMRGIRARAGGRSEQGEGSLMMV
ncbi:hypothetical protein V500_05198 [Pseudogymnoascus sp. VKM F-4518 (FW-2643)]|nr:hypothetical protein V500_05198 [Pseudogymnoascus sp. VKM F-4518 (FW-2643)]